MAVDDRNPRGAQDDATLLEMRRRDAFRIVFGAAAAAMVGLDEAEASTPAAPSFRHGVASGDPRLESVIIWTRVTPVTNRQLMVDWRVSSTSDMANIVASGQAPASPIHDFTVKVDVEGLQPGGTYFYQFAVGGVMSAVGRTRTLPANASRDPVSLAFFSCANYEKGFFNVYGEAARQADLFGVVHLGDYTYEYGVAGYLTPAMALNPTVNFEPRRAELVPATETVTLAAYRQRLALYRTDPQLQALHAHCPWFCSYDDHESTNDSWTGGAQNHTPGVEGDWQARKRDALRAWFEWMPVRTRDPRFDGMNNPQALYRHFNFGRVARLLMLDSRLAGRDRQLTTPEFLAVYGIGVPSPAPDMVDGRPRTLLGSAQEAWLDSELSTSRQVWQLIGNQTLLHYQGAADFESFPGFDAPTKAAIRAGLDGLFGAGAGAQFGQLGIAGGPNPEGADTWTGYPGAKSRLYASLLRARNPVVLSGDSHNAWAANLAAGRTPVGVEFGTASVTSPGLEQFFAFPRQVLEALMLFTSNTRWRNDKLVFADTGRRGYVRLNASMTELVATFVQVNTVLSTSYTVDASASFRVLPGARTIAPVAT